MAKLKVQTARKEYKCGKCNKTIGKGDRYFKIVARFQPVKIRCSDCKPKRSELSSGLKADIIAIEEDFEDWESRYGDKPCAEGLQELIEILEFGRDRLEDIRDELEEKQTNIEDYFPDSELAMNLQERAEACDEAINMIESLLSEIEDKLEGEQLDEKLLWDIISLGLADINDSLIQAEGL